MTNLTPAQFQRAKALVQAIEAKRARVAALKSYVESARMVTYAASSRRIDACLFPIKPERLAGAVAHHRRTDPDTKRMILERYHQLLAEMLESPYAGIKPTKVDFDALPHEARCYLLAPYLKLVVGNAFPRLDFQQSDPVRGVLVYTHTGGPADPEAWRPHLPQVSAWLGSNWQLMPHTATTITLIQRAELPAAIPMQAAMIRQSALFTGIDTATHQPTYLPFADMTSGTFVVGASGTGKSNATHILMQAILANLHLFQAVFCIDGKEGITFARYKTAAPAKLRILIDEPDVWKLTGQLVAIIRKRNASLRDAGLDSASTNLIAVLIEEMSTYTAKPSSDGKSQANKDHARFLDELAMLARRGRSAGLRLIITAQEPTDNQIPTTVRGNCQTVIAFKIPTDAHATMVFGQLDPSRDPRKLTRGRALIKHDNGTIQSVQFPVIPPPRGRP